jgi:GT2 family glycosyltransferase
VRDASVIIVTYGQWEFTERCLRSLEVALGPLLGDSWEVIVVDNNSPDETPQRLTEWSDRVRVELLPENRNFAGGCNRGAQLADSEVLIFLNSDTEVPPNTLQRLAEQVHEPGVAVAGCRLLFPGGAVQHTGVAFWHDEQFAGMPMPLHVFFGEDQDLSATFSVYEADTVTGACMAVRRDAFRAVGGFDEGFRNGYEDTDLCFRLRAEGHRVILRGDVTITHHEGVSRDGERRLDGTDDRVMATAHDRNVHNTSLFQSRWGAHLEQDDALALAVWDGALRKHAPSRMPDRVADVLVIGQPSGIGPGAEESRALIAALAGGGVATAAVDIHPNVVARVSGSQAEALENALRSVPHRGASNLYLASGRGFEYRDPSHQVTPTAGALLRLGAPDTILDLRELGQVLVPSTAVAGALVANGLPESQVALMPSPVERRPLGPGGGGVLVILPVQHPTLAQRILAELRDLAARFPVRILPTAFRRDLAADLESDCPGAQLLGPCSDESRFASLAATADVVVAIDPADFFERRALVAASVGSKPLTGRASGPAAEALGDEVAIESENLGVAILSAITESRPRVRWQDAVRAHCDPEHVTRAIVPAAARS